jgi:hypothetical protein
VKIAYFDTIAGVSGDMTLGAFVSAGLPIDELRAEIAKLNLDGIELDASHVVRNGITAVKVDVVISVKQTHHRHVRDIFQIIDASSLSPRVKENARKIFMEVATAEAKVHNSTVEKIHFHEVGALDSIVDIVGAAVCFERLGIEAAYSSPVRLGSGGFVNTAHGKLPLPAPAVSEILNGYPTVLTDIPHELTTPTGAAIIKAMSNGVLAAEAMNVTAIGYGAGSMEFAELPNLLRIMIAELPERYGHDELVMVETNIDDMNPEIYPYLVEKLLSAGANDAFLVPVIMKKGRPGVLVSALVGRSRIDAITHVLFTQTSTIGVRILPTERRKLSRESREIETPLGRAKFKVVRLDGKEKLLPEFEECKRLAEARNIPLIEVYRMLSDLR